MEEVTSLSNTLAIDTLEGVESDIQTLHHEWTDRGYPHVNNRYAVKHNHTS